MAASLTATTVFGALASGNQNLNLFDAQFTSILGGLNSLNTFGNYYVDGGSANAYAVTVPTTQTVTFGTTAGAPISFRVLNANTGASTLAVTAGTTVTTGSIVTQGGAALPPGTLAAGAVATVIWDGTKFSLQSASGLSASQLTASLGTDVTLGSTGIFFDGPTIAQGTTGTWWVSGSVSLKDTAGAANMTAKLWDGTSVISSGQLITQAANNTGVIALSGFLASPAGNLRISARDATSASGAILSNGSGAGKDGTISAFRIA